MYEFRIDLMKLLIILFIILFPYSLFSQTEFIGRSEIQHFNWGGTQHKWNNLYSLRDLNISRGPMGRLDIILDDNSPREEENTELLLHFDRCKKDSIVFASQNYRVQEVDIFPSQDIKKFGQASAGFLHYHNIIAIKPLKGSVFLKDGTLGSFTIDFFLFPTSVQEGKTVFSWYAPSVDLGGFNGFKVYFKDGKLFWIFEKVFQKSNGDHVQVLIGEREKTPINEWHHHAVHYNSENGLLSVYFNGQESNLVWLTENGKEEGTILNGVISPYLVAPMIIGEEYLGYIDEFRISRGRAHFYLGNYRENGEIRSDVMSMPSKATKLVKVSWESIEKHGTAIRVYCRMSDSYFLPYESAGEPAWLQVINNVAFDKEYSEGKYLQWKAELLGTEGIYTPYFLSLDIALELDHPPTAPTLLRALPMNGAVRLIWVKNKESDIKGYKVYYGTSSRYYFGKGADKGDSPIFVNDISSFDLQGLENEKVYFISITAVDNEDQESAFSKEFITRPSSIYSE